MGSHIEATIASKAKLIHEVYARDRTGRMAYYFVMVDEAKQNTFIKALDNPPVNIAEYGLILASGYGEVPNRVKDYLLKKYCYKMK